MSLSRRRFGDYMEVLSSQIMTNRKHPENISKPSRRLGDTSPLFHFFLQQKQLQSWMKTCCWLRRYGPSLVRSDRYLAKARAKFTKNAGSLWMFNVTIVKMRQMILHPKIVRFDLKWFDCHFTKMSGTMEQTKKETYMKHTQKQRNKETNKKQNMYVSRDRNFDEHSCSLPPAPLSRPFRSKAKYAKIIMEMLHC